MNKNIVKPKELKELREFGLGMSFGTTILSGILILRGKSAAPFVLLIPICIIPLALYAPTILKPLHLALRWIGLTIQSILTYIIAISTYYIAITPIGTLLRASKKDLLKLTRTESDKSYWIKVEQKAEARYYTPY